MKVLLVDDSSTMRKIQTTQLKQLGIHNILEAENGEDVLTVLKDNMPVDAILLDRNMPVMDGLTFLQKVRTDTQYKNVKIFMCTSESEKSKVIEAPKAGANNYIIKIFTSDVLKQKLGI